ncbi:MAG: LuxR C-terminal-related transcriptional regulator [Thermoanaerobaculia bacterium]
MDTLHRLRIAIEGLQLQNNGDLQKTKSEILGLIDQLNIVQPDGDSKHHRLSPREREVMTMILSGQRLKEIAAKLDISVKTVTTHRSRLLRKLAVEDNLGLYRYGIRNGFITV